MKKIDELDDSPPECPLTLFVDADACPVAIKDIVFRVARRRRIMTVVVANQTISIPDSEWIWQVTVNSGLDEADHRIVEMVRAGDVVIADDVPLAARVVEKGAVVIGSRGQRYDETNIHNRLASRDLMEQLRVAGVVTEGPKPFKPKDAQAFANQLDRVVTKKLREG